MKGTAPRAVTDDCDRLAAKALQMDEKNRAEHVMIVDLMRNDLGRICQTGSIRVDDLFHVEAYPTVHQMVSTVSGTLKQSIRWQQVFEAIFPSGSITGAPKRRTMQIIHQLESTARGIYTGAIGYIAPTGESAFSVAIRTLTLQAAEGRSSVSMGVGGGIVADSLAAAEWNECLLKSSFVHRASEDFLLIETMLVEGTPPHVRRLGLHMERLAASAFALGFRMDERAVRSAIAEACGNESAGPRKLRLTLRRDGEVRVTTASLDPWPTALNVTIAPDRTDPDDPALRYKTTFRNVYDNALRETKRKGWDECIFLNQREELTEGCVTNLLILRGNRLQTPASVCGVLPGVMRQSLLAAGLLEEAVLYPADLAAADAMYLCNSVRGVIPVIRLRLESCSVLNFDADKISRYARQLMERLERFKIQ